MPERVFDLSGKSNSTPSQREGVALVDASMKPAADVRTGVGFRGQLTAALRCDESVERGTELLVRLAHPTKRMVTTIGHRWYVPRARRASASREER